MNKDNYCTLEAAQRLVDAGIELETESMWMPSLKDPIPMLVHCSTEVMRKVAADRQGSIPAPSMAEVWRELPDACHIAKNYGLSYAYLYDGPKLHSTTAENVNPTDALVALLIWLKRREK